MFPPKMRAVQSTLALILFAVSSAAGAWVCYPGQEPSPASEGRLYRWLLAQKSLAECTEFRLGGLNARSHGKLHEVVIGGDRDLGKLERLKTEGGRSTEEACATITTDEEHPLAFYPPHGYFKSPLERLEFALSACRSNCLLGLNERDKLAVYSILFSEGEEATIFRDHGDEVSIGGHLELSSRLWLTYNSSEMQLGLAGSQEPVLRLLAARSPPVVVRSLTFSSNDLGEECQFFTPCY